MDGRFKWAELVREARIRRNLTQRELARGAGVPQPTIAEIEAARREPSLSLVSRIVESVGFGIRVELTPLRRYSAVSAGARGRLVLAEGLSNSEASSADDQLLRIMLSFRDALLLSETSELQRLIGDPPDRIGDERWDAFLAAVVEDVCASRDVTPPRWVNAPEKFLKPFWFLSENRRLHDWEFETAPAAFVRHGILAAAEELESV